MHKKVVILLLSLFLMKNIWSAPNPAYYSEATDVFELMDHMSLWHPSLSRDYIRAWSKRFTLSSEDKNYLSEYKKIRLRYHKSVGEGADLFGEMPIGYDRFSKAFYSSQSVAEALKKLEKNNIRKDDIIFIKRFYKHFQKSIIVFMKESSQFQVNMFGLNKKWSLEKYKPYIKKMTTFLLGKKGSKVKIIMRPVWLPKSAKPRIDLRGPYIILRAHPLDTKYSWDPKLLLKNSVWALINGQPKKQRNNLTKQFKGRCVGREREFRGALDIVFTKMLPEYTKSKKTFDLYRKWGGSYFEDLYSKLLFPLAGKEIKGKGGFSGRFFTESSNICYDLNRLAVAP